MPTPHDALVKALFSNTHDAASALASALPRDIASRIDWSTLTQENLNLVDRRFREFQSDIVFSALLQQRKIFLYVLLEHQSTGDRLMPFRMLRYSVLLWDTFLKNHPDVERLPAVLPVVLCHGKSPWASPTAFAEIVDVPDDLAGVLDDHLPQFRFVLDDLASVDDAALHSRSLTEMMFAGLLLLKKAPYSSDLGRDLAAWIDVFVSIGNAPNGLDALRLLLEYISLTANAEPTTIEQFARAIGPVAERAYMTAAEKLTQQGREEGRKAGQAELVLRLLSLRFGEPNSELLARVHAASNTELTRWAERILTASTLDDVFAE